MATIAQKKQIKEYLTSCPDGADIESIVKGTGIDAGAVRTLLTNLKAEGTTVILDRGVWALAKPEVKGASASPLPSPAPSPEEPGSIMKANAEVEETPSVHLPGEYEKFMQIGRSLGIKEDFLKVATDHIFTGDTHNLNYVWDALNELYLRPDVTRRWFNTWSRAISVPIPVQIAAQIMPKTTEAAKEAEIKAPTRFDVIGDEIVANPEGEFTFSMARQYLMTKAVQGAAPQLAGEKVTEIISVLTPFLESQRTARAEEIEKQGETSILATLVKSLIESKGGNAQQPLTLADVITVVDKIDEARRATATAMAASAAKTPDSFSELERMVNLFTQMRGLFGSPAKEGSGVTIAVGGSNGQVGAIPLETYFQLEDHRRKIRQEDDELDNKREMGKTVRGFLDRISKAAANVANR